MPPGRRWHFEVRGRDIVLIRAGEEMESLCGLKYGAIKDITVGKSSKPGERNEKYFDIDREERGESGYSYHHHVIFYAASFTF